MSEQRIRLLVGEPEYKLFGPYCDVLLNGKEVDRTLVFAADEEEGWIDFLKVKREGAKFRTYVTEGYGVAMRPVLRRETGAVTIRLREDAPARIRTAYEGWRAGERGRP